LVKLIGWAFSGYFEYQLQQFTYWETRTANDAAKSAIEQSFSKTVKNGIKLALVSIKPLTASNKQVIFTTVNDMNVAMLARGKLYR